MPPSWTTVTFVARISRFLLFGNDTCRYQMLKSFIKLNPNLSMKDHYFEALFNFLTYLIIFLNDAH